MSWSTRELAELASTTVNTVRHYHRRGLLEEPDRYSSGYKKYGVPHLIRLLQIRRLREIGVPIAQIERLEAGVGTSPEVLEAIDADLAESIERGQRLRAEIADILQHGSITEVPSGFARVAPRLSATERSLTLVYSQLYDLEAMDDVREMLETDPDDATVDFESLPADADDATRAELAERFAQTLARTQAKYPWMSGRDTHLVRTPSSTADTMAQTLHAIYNPAQLDVLERAHARARTLAGADGEHA